VARLSPLAAKIRSLRSIVTGKPLSLPVYRDAGLSFWVERMLALHRIRNVLVFSSPMAQYVIDQPELNILIDFVDVDSAKWSQYAESLGWPLSWICRREGKRLLEYERRTASRASCAFFVTENERSLFVKSAPECAAQVKVLGNGVDAQYFSPRAGVASPYPNGELALVFTGAMDYWPNVDAVRWFAGEILPRLRRNRPQMRFYIVGMRPAAAVQALAAEGVVVTGSVPDVRPYLQHAAIAVAPLRIARGIQNKVLEAMAMARPMVLAKECAHAIESACAAPFVRAQSVEEFIRAIEMLLGDPVRAAAMGCEARKFVLERYSWERQLAPIEAFLYRRQPGLPEASFAAPTP
jgi:sugar transferase (PEP-CTERM/EpsH1 system associated)